MFFNVVIPGVWVKNIELKPSGNIYALNRLGIGYFAIHFYIYLILAFYNLFNKYKESDNFIKKQLLQLILFASIISFFGGFFSVLIPLILLDLGPYWVGPYFSLPLIFYLSWFIFKKN